MDFPNNYKNNSLLTEDNRNNISLFLNKNINKNLLNANFWNYKLIIDNYDKNENRNFEKSFLNLFFLTKNNKKKNIDLKKYFISNYNYFSEKNKKIVLENYN